MVLLLLVLAASPSIKGLDAPKKEQRATLGESETTRGKVKIRCVDVGAMMLVEINDPGLIGARDVWLRKKNGDAMPPCDANDAGVVHVEGAPGFGYVTGTKGDFLFVTSADSFANRAGVRVFSLRDGQQVYEADADISQRIEVVTKGKQVLLRFHLAIASTCEPRGEEAEKCWKEIRESAHVPDSVKLTPPPCDAVFKGKTGLTGTTLLALPVEVELSAQKTPLRFVDGHATCEESN